MTADQAEPTPRPDVVPAWFYGGFADGCACRPRFAPGVMADMRRPRRTPPMTDLSTPVIGLLIAAVVIAAARDVAIVQNALVGIAIGTVTAKVLIWRYERRWGELSGRRVRQIEALWITIGLLVTVLISLLAEVS